MSRTWEENYEQIEKAADMIADSLNGGNIVTDQRFIERMASQHRTLQQDFTRLCIRWFEHLAVLAPGQYDLRNEDSVDFAKKLMQTDAYKDCGGCLRRI